MPSIACKATVSHANANMKIGYIGLGALGSALAQRFLPDHSLWVWDINPAAVVVLEKLGAHGAASAAELARECDVILLCLPRSADVHQVIFGPAGLAEGLTAGKLLIDQTSGISSDTREIARQLAARDVAMLDSAVSGSPELVAKGGATLMASGPDEVFERALPFLRSIAPTVHRCGARVGDGQAMKTLNNAMNAACRLGTLEVVVMGRKMGLSLECMADILNRSWAGNQTTAKMLPALSEGKTSTDFALSLALKDQGQAVSLGMNIGVPMPISNVVRGLFQIGINTLGQRAQLEDVVGLVESMAATRLVQHVEAPFARSSAPSKRVKKDAIVGFVGLGSSGGALARRHMQSGKTYVYDSQPELTRAFTAEGANAAPDLPFMARVCDVIVLCLPSSAVVRELVFGEGGLAQGLSGGKLVIDQTMGDPAETRRIAAELEAMSVQLIDVSVLSGPTAADADRLLLMCGGAPDALDFANPVLCAITPNIVYCGPSGSGHLARVIVNAVFSICHFATCECAAVGFKYGLTVADMAQVINTSSGWSGASRRILSEANLRQQASGFQLHAMEKDLVIAAGLGILGGTPLLILNVVRSLFEVGANRLGGSADINEMVNLHETMASIRFDGK